MYAFKQKKTNNFVSFNFNSRIPKYVEGFLHNVDVLVFSEVIQAVNWLKVNKDCFNKDTCQIEDMELVSLSVNSLNANLKLICG